jgi:hypothetical protein
MVRFVVRVENQSSSTAGSNVDRNRRDNDLQYFRPEEVDRIEIEGRSLDDTRYETRNVQVTLDSNWTDSGVWVRRGERVQVSATGCNHRRSFPDHSRRFAFNRSQRPVAQRQRRQVDWRNRQRPALADYRARQQLMNSPPNATAGFS